MNFSFLSKHARKVRYFLGKRILSGTGYCGKNVNFERNSYFSRCLKIGDNSGIGISSIIMGDITIGNNVMMGQNVCMFSSNHEYRDANIEMIKQGSTPSKPIIICDDVWIGANVVVLPGVKISRGCVIGAGSIVTKSTEEYGVYCGNPARLIKKRT